MQKWHQFFNIAMRGDQPFGHIVRMAGHVADPAKPGYPIERADKAIKALGLACVVLASPCIYILAKQCDFFGASVNNGLCLVEQIGPTTRNFRASSIGYDALGTEFVAAFLNRQER